MGFEPTTDPSRKEGVNQFVDRMKSTLEEAKSALKKLKEEMTQYYNQRREPAPIYKPGDRVFLDGSDIQMTQPSKKLAHKFLVPTQSRRLSDKMCINSNYLSQCVSFTQSSM